MVDVGDFHAAKARISYLLDFALYLVCVHLPVRPPPAELGLDIRPGFGEPTDEVAPSCISGRTVISECSAGTADTEREANEPCSRLEIPTPVDAEIPIAVLITDTTL